jgi:hypothetical protein
MILGICGVATSGKDTFFHAAQNLLSTELNKTDCVRVAFADELKYETDAFLTDNIGISSFTKDPAEKELIRPFLVTYGTHIRRKLDQECWIKKLEKRIRRINKASNEQVLLCVTDVRFKNEVKWVQDQGGKVIHVSREEDGKIIPPANKDEEENDPIIKEMADVTLEWKTKGDDASLYKTEVSECLKTLKILN